MLTIIQNKIMKSIFVFSLLFTFNTLQAQSDSARIPKKDSAIYYNPEIQVEFPGGNMAWNRFVSANLVYPSDAAEHNIQGTVEVRFIVDPDGTAHDFVTISGPEELRAEAIRILKKAYWVSAIANGKRAKAYAVKTVIFKL